MAMATGPVRGMHIDTSQAPAQSQYDGQTYFFCSVECRQKFEADPKQYAKAG